MRNLILNKKEHIGLNYVGEIEYRDAQGNMTGEKILSYGDEIPFKSHISGASGSIVLDNNGVIVEYDKSFVITKEEFDRLGFNENTVFFIDKKPEYDVNDQPIYDYKVKRIKDTLNEVMVLLEKVRNK